MCSELYEPAVTSSDVKASPSGPASSTHGQPAPEGAEYLVQHRKDTWRGGVPLQSAGTSLLYVPNMCCKHEKRARTLCKCHLAGSNIRMTMSLTLGRHELQFTCTFLYTEDCAVLHIICCVSAESFGNEGPIRSRLVDNGYHGEPDPAKGARLGNGPGPRAWNHHQVDAEQPAHPGPPANASRPARPMVHHQLLRTSMQM